MFAYSRSTRHRNIVLASRHRHFFLVLRITNTSPLDFLEKKSKDSCRTRRALPLSLSAPLSRVATGRVEAAHTQLRMHGGTGKANRTTRQLSAGDQHHDARARVSTESGSARGRRRKHIYNSSTVFYKYTFVQLFLLARTLPARPCFVCLLTLDLFPLDALSAAPERCSFRPSRIDYTPSKGRRCNSVQLKRTDLSLHCVHACVVSRKSLENIFFPF